METLDELITKYGMDVVKFAAQGTEEPKQNLTNFQPLKNQTTNIDDIITVP